MNSEIIDLYILQGDPQRISYIVCVKKLYQPNLEEIEIFKDVIDWHSVKNVLFSEHFYNYYLKQTFSTSKKWHVVIMLQDYRKYSIYS